MKRVTVGNAFEVIEQMRADRGLEKGQMAELMGMSSHAWRQIVYRRNSGASPRTLFATVEKAFKAMGYGLYIAPLPKEEQGGEES